jgi:uncharacterized protein (TIGR02594 family)
LEVATVEITLFDIAQRFVGIKEVPGREDNSQILAMLRLDHGWPEGDEVAWCSAFVNYCAWLLRLPRSKSLMARSWLNVGRSVPFAEAQVGFDIVVLWRVDPSGMFGHVGIFAGSQGESVMLLGGNQSDAVSVAPYPVSRLLGVRRLHAEPIG